MVATGHYFEGSILWVPVSIGLFIFAFSSGYFSANRYGGKVEWRAFWINKAHRLFPSLMVVNLFLLALFLIEGRNGLLTIHTLLGVFGLSGILDWLGIHNQSPFGNGLWFFTVLMIFYLVYPLLGSVVLTRRRALVFLTVSAAICIFGHVFISPPYALWPTVFGFCLGVFAGRISWHPARHNSILSLIVSVVLLLLFNIINLKVFNALFMAAISIFTIAVLLSVPLHRKILGPFSVLLPCIFEIYFIHTYLFMDLSAYSRLLGFVASIVLVLIVAFSLYKFRLGVVREILKYK